MLVNWSLSVVIVFRRGLIASLFVPLDISRAQAAKESSRALSEAMSFLFD
jgi:hypothetical protein